MLRSILPLSLLVVAGLSLLATFTSPASSAPASATAASAAVKVKKGDKKGGSLKGAHGFSYSGTVEGMGAVASSGRIEFDGAGKLSAVFTTSVGGMPFTGSFKGSYTVNKDGTGSVVIDLPWLGLQSGGDFVIVDNGKGTYFTSTEMGYSVTGRTQRM